MKEDKPNSEKRTDIRKQAEDILKGNTTDLEKLSSGDAQSLVHELQVHQVELEIQNEELRRAQKELEDARDRYSDLYDFSPIGYFTFDKKGLILQANLTGAKKIGRERGNLIKKPFSLYITTDHKYFYSHLHRVFDIGIQSTCELRLVDKSGNQFDVLLESIPVHDSDGNLLARTAMSDITQRKLTEEDLKQVSQKLRRSNDELKHFAYIISHDLQEPLRTISSFLQLIEMRYKGQLDNDIDKFITFAIDGANRLHIMIEGLLAYSRVETQGNKFEKADFSDVLKTTIMNLKIAIQESGTLITSDPLPTVCADGSQFIQVFQNLISNSIKFNSIKLPKIHVSAKQISEKEGSKTSDVWLFSVEDNGIGMDPKHKDKLFNIFQRLHGSEYKGIGIGLSLCKRIVERHGGRIWFESKVGKGTTFYFTIPTNLPIIEEKTVEETTNWNNKQF
jgi:chemotaxis family two-component system sensor kinase Cph1